MNKCEWKDEGFRACDGLGKQGMQWDHDGIDWIEGIDIEITFCPFCGADIRKPEPEKPLIVRSGGTLVMEKNKINYLCLKPKEYPPEVINRIMQKGSDPLHYYEGDWKPFNEIILDDEIAGRFRPMVIFYNLLLQLVHVQDEGHHHAYSKSEDRYYTSRFNCRLATASELQEAE